MIESYNIEYEGIFLFVIGEYHEGESGHDIYPIPEEFHIEQVIVGEVNIIKLLNESTIEALELLALNKREQDER